MKSHSLFRLASKVYNTPHLITAEAFNVVLDYLDVRNNFKLATLTDTLSTPPLKPDNKANGIGVVPIDGSLTYKPVQTECGEVGTSYSSIVDQVEDLIDSGCKTLVFDVTSGGGEASHVFQSAEVIRQMCDDAGVNLIAYADTLACSAAYALSVVADEIVVNPSATVGSIGCVVALMDTSKAMEQAGLKRIFVTSGESKVPYAADGTFKQEFLDDIQDEVDELNGEFSAFVSKYTGIPQDTIKGFQAKTFNAQDAVNAGLANKVMTNQQFAAYVASVHQGASNA